MAKPILVIMAAGMGSRYGGLKQMDPVGGNGELILDYSLFDAKRAGFERAVIIIKRENEQDFRDVLGDRVAKHMEIRYAYQELGNVPAGYAVPEGRTKPWGTGHAVLSAYDLLDAPFCAINADDYYGVEAFRLAYDHLTHLQGDGDIAMVGYLLKNTMSDTGFVSRGVCGVDTQGRLQSLRETEHIIHSQDGPLYTEDGQTYRKLSPEAVVSMNFWAFPQKMRDALRDGFPRFLSEKVPQNPVKAEYYLPSAVDALVNEGHATVRVLTTADRWHGVTYHEDKPEVVAALASMAKEGVYPAPLWS